ncbi:hypothetical protein L3X38_010348 [Prunus dulcis]|uniref:Retrotransposon Copia-like N-terminal domain-containing protein n=1 Tax=Prunus dulcis TaxID=3755 RepID=A0AAD4ZEP1_PRUDU|nr:hypothetical protein L3X38_010348 [Prunus dulcis]
MGESTLIEPKTPVHDSLDLHNSDTLGRSLVDFKLEGHNYGQWSRSMHLSPSAKNKLGLIDGSIKAPSPTDSKFSQQNSHSGSAAMIWFCHGFFMLSIQT